MLCVCVCAGARMRGELKWSARLISIDYFQGVGETFSLPPGERERERQRERVCVCVCAVNEKERQKRKRKKISSYKHRLFPGGGGNISLPPGESERK